MPKRNPCTSVLFLLSVCVFFAPAAFGESLSDVRTYPLGHNRYLATRVVDIGPYWEKYLITLVHMKKNVPYLERVDIETFDQEKNIGVTTAFPDPFIVCSGSSLRFNADTYTLHCLSHHTADEVLDLTYNFALTENDDHETQADFHVVKALLRKYGPNDSYDGGAVIRTLYQAGGVNAQTH